MCCKAKKNKGTSKQVSKQTNKVTLSLLELLVTVAAKNDLTLLEANDIVVVVFVVLVIAVNVIVVGLLVVADPIVSSCGQ